MVAFLFLKGMTGALAPFSFLVYNIKLDWKILFTYETEWHNIWMRSKFKPLKSIWFWLRKYHLRFHQNYALISVIFHERHWMKPTAILCWKRPYFSLNSTHDKFWMKMYRYLSSIIQNSTQTNKNLWLCTVSYSCTNNDLAKAKENFHLILLNFANEQQFQFCSCLNFNELFFVNPNSSLIPQISNVKITRTASVNIAFFA